MARKLKINRHIGKIGWCSKETLGLLKSHYVFIRMVKKW